MYQPGIVFFANLKTVTAFVVAITPLIFEKKTDKSHDTQKVRASQAAPVKCHLKIQRTHLKLLESLPRVHVLRESCSVLRVW